MNDVQTLPKIDRSAIDKDIKSKKQFIKMNLDKIAENIYRHSDRRSVFRTNSGRRKIDLINYYWINWANMLISQHVGFYNLDNFKF